MKYLLFRGQEYNYIEDVLEDAYQDEFIYGGYLKEALNEFPPFVIFDGICGGDCDLANKIREAVDNLIIQDIKEINE